MASRQPLDFFDNFILYEIKQFGTLRDLELARRLQCPRTALLDRLEKLWRTGYLSSGPSEGHFSLTEKGLDSCIPLEQFFSAPREICTLSPEAFDWTALYIPEPGWLDDQAN